MGLAVGVDVGGTKIAAGVVDEVGAVVHQVRRDCPADDERAVLEAIVGVVEFCRQDADVAAVGVAAAGFVRADRSTVSFAPNLAWRDEPLGERLRERLGLPVAVENDANAAAWAEHRFGAGRGEDLACVTVGTGIGGGLVLQGRLVRGRFGFAAELGHMALVAGGRPCGCGQRGCWEQYASGRALLREARDAAERDPGRAARLLALGDGTPEGIRGVHVTVAAAAGDEAACHAFRAVTSATAQGLWRLSAMLAPPVVVLAGGVIDAGELYLAPVRAALAELAGDLPAPDVRPAALGGAAGVIGAADLARR